MGTGYTRKDTSNNIANGNVINADDLDAEFNGIEDAFNSSTGHTHDGTSAEGAPIEVIGPNQEYVSDGTALYPKADDNYDLGKNGAEWKDLYIDGTANIDSLVADTADINGGTIDGATIGGSSAGAGTFTTLTATGNVVLGDAATDTVTITADVSSNIIPSVDNTYDLGASGSEWKDLYIDGTANIDSLVADAGTIGGSNITTTDNTQTLTNKTINSANNTITVDLTEATVTGTLAEFNSALSDDNFVSLTGSETLTNKTLTSPDINGGTVDDADVTVGTGKTLDVSAGTLTLANDQISGDNVEGGTINAITINTLSSTTVDTTNLEVTNLKAKDGTAAGSIANSTGVVTLDSSVLTTTDINGGTIDGATIATSDITVGLGKTLDVSAGTLTLANDQISGDSIEGGTIGSVSITSADINGGTIDGVTLGTNSAVTEAQIDNININGNTISSTDTNGNIALTPDGTGEVDITKVDIDGGTIDGTVIGGASPAAGTFTTVTASGDVTIADKIVHDGDTNTAIRFPAADTVTVETGGTERMRIASSGNVGIGTSSPGARLNVIGGNIQCDDDLATGRYNIGSNGAYLTRYASDGSIGLVTSQGSVLLATAGTERMHITSGGLVGIGTSSPGTSLQVEGAVRSHGTAIRTGQSGSWGGSVFNIYWTGSVANLYIDTTNLGAIQTSSDYRIKRNVETQTEDALPRVMQLRPVTYQPADYGELFKASDEVKEGFIAHELAEVVPSAVQGEKDDPNQIQSLKLDALVSVLTKAIQEQQSIIEALEARVAQLEGN